MVNKLNEMINCLENKTDYLNVKSFNVLDNNPKQKFNYKNFDLIYFEIFTIFILGWYHNT